MSKDRCIDPNNATVVKLADSLGKSRYEVAIDIEMWQNIHGNRIPTVEELIVHSNAAFPLVGNEDKYKHYDLLTKKGEIKTVNGLTKERIKDWMSKLNKSPYFSFKLRATSGGLKILIFKKDSTEKSLFNTGGEAVNVLDQYFDGNTATSTEILNKIALSDNELAPLAKKLLKFAPDTELSLLDVASIENGSIKDMGKMQIESAAGVYIPGKNKIYIAKGASFKYSTEETLIHEILHAMTHNYITNNENKEFKELYEYIKQNVAIRDKYAISTIDEFMVAIFTNPSFVKDLKNTPARDKKFTSFWGDLLNYFKKLLRLTPETLTLFDEVFSRGAQLIEEAYTNKEFQKEMNGIDDTIFLADVVMEPIQNKIVNFLNALQKKVEKINEEYIVEGFTNKWKRASSAAKKTIQNRSRGIETPEQKELGELYTGAGTLMHAMQANIVKEAFPEANTHFEYTEIPLELVEINDALTLQLMPFIENAKKRGSVLRAETFVGNSTSTWAGSIDLLEITDEGKYIIYDLKTRFAGGEKSAVGRYNKIDEWSRQTAVYKKILEEGDSKLGIVKGEVIGAYILELDIEKISQRQVKLKGKSAFKGTDAVAFLKARNLKELIVVAPTFLRTKDDKIDSLIESLLNQTEQISKMNAKGDIDIQVKEELLASKLELLQQLQLKKEITKLIEHGYTDLFQIEKMLSNGELGEKSQIVKEQLALYANILDYIDDDISKEQEDILKEMRFFADKLQKKYYKEGEKLIVKGANSEGIAAQVAAFGKTIFSASKDIGWFKKEAGGISTVNNPLTATAYGLLTSSLDRAREKLQLLANKIVEARDAYIKQLGSADYSLMINLNNSKEPVMVREFSNTFYVEQNKQKKLGNMDWFDENVFYNKEEYDQKREKQVAFYDSQRDVDFKRLKVLNPNMTNQQLLIEVEKNIKQKMDIWTATNKGNKSIYFIPKAKWKDPKWVEIKEGKYKGTAVEEFYDLFIQTMDTARELAPHRIDKNFIPNFLKDFIDRSAEQGLLGAIKGSWSGILEGYELGIDRELYSSKDSISGEIVNQLFAPGMTGTNAQNKSQDLAGSLFKFMEGIYRYEELSQIEQTILALKHHIKYKTKFIRTDALGRPLDEQTAPAQNNVNSNTSYIMDSWVDAVFYGVKNKKESAFEIKGNSFTKLLGILDKDDTKKISIAKIIDSFLAYTSLRNLGVNIYAPIVNLFGGAANAYMTGAGGLYYKPEDITWGMGMALAGKTNFPNEDSKKASLILDWLQIDTGEFKKDIENELSSYKIKRLQSKFNLLSVMSLSEQVLRNAGALAMIKDGRHGFNFDDFSVVDGKLVVSSNPILKSKLRQKIIAVNSKNIGGLNPDDLMAAKTYIVGRMLMQHRSWLPAMFFERFGERQHSFILQHEVEGRYLTAYRLFSAYYTKSKRANLTPLEKANMRSAAVEAGLLLSIGLLYNLMNAALDDDDKKEAWFKVTNKINQRVFSELLFFVDPTFESQYKILLSPAASLGTVGDMGKFVGSLYKEAVETDEKKLKRNHPLVRGVKLIPGVNKVESFFGDLGVGK